MGVEGSGTVARKLDPQHLESTWKSPEEDIDWEFVSWGFNIFLCQRCFDGFKFGGKKLEFEVFRTQPAPPGVKSHQSGNQLLNLPPPRPNRRAGALLDDGPFPGGGGGAFPSGTVLLFERCFFD